MPTFNSQQLITELQNETESMLRKATNEWQKLPEKIMLYKESAEKWSAAQCLMHLNSYGNFYLPVIAKSIEEAEVKQWHSESFRTSFIGNWFTELMLPKGEEKRIKKMKSPKNHTPLANDNSDVVIAEFIDQQERLLQLLNRSEKLNLRKAKMPVSISRFIKLPLGDTLRFLIAHNQRHILQAERVLLTAKSK